MQQKFLALPTGVIVVVAFVVIGVVVWLLTQAPSRPSPSAQDGEQTQAQPQETDTDTQVKEDLARAASALNVYVANNSGRYPANDTEAAKVIQQYVSASSTFISPLTDASYTMVLSNKRAPGVINLERGVCNNDKNSIVPTQNSRTYAILTQLSDKSLYCVDV